MAVRWRVGREWLDRYGAVGDLQDSTIWRDGRSGSMGYSGDHEASCTFGARADFSAPWFRSGSLVEVVENGVVTWSGFLGEPQQGDVWTLAAFGWGADAANYLATDREGSNMNFTIDDATAAGLGFSRYANDFLVGAWKIGKPTLPLMLDEAMDRNARTAGKVWWVSVGEASLRAEPSAVSWVMSPNGAYLGTTDEELVTTLQGFYVTGTVTTAPDSGTGSPVVTPVAWSTVEFHDPAAAAKFRPHQRVVDLTALGRISGGEAQQIVAARFAQVGARAAWTNGFEMTTLNSASAVNGVPNPMGVRAGQRVRVPGVTDMRSGVTYLASVEVTAGKVTRHHADQRAVVEPLGMVARDFQGALAAAQPANNNVEEI